jgi:hypothetical protein
MCSCMFGEYKSVYRDKGTKCCVPCSCRQVIAACRNTCVSTVLIAENHTVWSNFRMNTISYFHSYGSIFIFSDDTKDVSDSAPKPQCVAVSWVRRLVAGLSTRRPVFDSGSVHVGFVVDKVALGQVFPPSTSVFLCQFHPTGAPFHGKTKWN